MGSNRMPDRLSDDEILLIKRTADRMLSEVRKRIVGMDHVIEGCLIALLSGGHVLLEGVPGLAKTLLAMTLSETIEGSEFSRIQFTPDLMPADIMGSEVYNFENHRFEVRKGPIFANLVLADEINRAPPKTQSALLEAMQERQVTIGGRTFPLEPPFLLMATQNPIEMEGTYPLPEAQLDRFMFKLVLEYPSAEQEAEIVRMYRSRPLIEVDPVVSSEEITKASDLAKGVFVSKPIEEYVVLLTRFTRGDEENAPEPIKKYVEWGMSTRSAVMLEIAAMTRAVLDGRGYVTPRDIKGVFPDIARHRVILKPEASFEGIGIQDVISVVLDHTPLPTMAEVSPDAGRIYRSISS